MRHWIFVMPSPNEHVWRAEVRRLAAVHDIAVQDWDGVSELLEEGVVLTAEPVHAPEGWQETAIISPSSSTLHFLQNLGFNYTDAVRRVSQYLSYAIAVDYKNGRVLSSKHDAEPVIDGLGLLEPVLAPESDEPIAPLKMFDAGIPAEGSNGLWGADLFAFSTYGQPLALNTSPEIDVTGRTRILVFGPQISLCPGEWTIRATIDCDPEGSKSRYFASWGTRDSRTEQLIDIDQPGQFDISMSARWDSGTEAEFIICSREPLFTGKMKFLSAEVVYNGR